MRLWSAMVELPFGSPLPAIPVPRNRRWRWLLGCLVFGVSYGALARLGLTYSSIPPNVTLI